MKVVSAVSRFVADYPTRTSVRSWVGDVRDLAALREATRGADTVIHTAARVSFGTHPDLVGMRNVNVKGPWTLDFCGLSRNKRISCCSKC